VAKANGFSLHAGVSCEARQRGKRERHAAMTWAQRWKRVFDMPQGTLS
jgi:hypothetical protein